MPREFARLDTLPEFCDVYDWCSDAMSQCLARDTRVQHCHAFTFCTFACYPCLGTLHRGKLLWLSCVPNIFFAHSRTLTCLGDKVKYPSPSGKQHEWPLFCLQAIVAYSPQQIRDLMHLRRLFYSKVGQLCRERKALLRHMANEQDVGADIGLDDISVRLSEVSDFAEQLRANGADEYKTYMQFSSAFSRGVRHKPPCWVGSGRVTLSLPA